MKYAVWKKAAVFLLAACMVLAFGGTAAFAEGEWFMNDQWSATVGGRVMWSDIFGGNNRRAA